MTVSSEINRSGPYNGNGSTTVFDYEFKIEDEEHLQVVLADEDGLETTLVLATDYTVSGVGAAEGGSVTLAVAPATGETLVILPDPPFTQELDLENQGAFLAESIERAIDLSVMRDKKLQEQMDRALLIPATADPAELEGLIDNVIRLTESANNIDIVAGSIDNVDLVGESIANVNTVAGHIANVDTVAGSIDNVDLVGESIANVNTVAGHIAKVDIVADHIANVDIVADNIDDIQAKQSLSEKGQPDGYAGLDGSGKVPAAQLPSYVDDVVEYANQAAFPATGETGKIYLALDTEITYRWSGSAYVEIGGFNEDRAFAVWPSGTLRTLKERATTTYNLADAPGSPDPTGANASTSALIDAIESGLTVEIPPGEWVTEEELEVVQPGQIIKFLGNGGFGYGSEPRANWLFDATKNARIKASGSWFAASGERVRTRRLYRASGSDPQDAPLSAVLNIQAEGVEVYDPCIWLDCDYGDASPSNLGDDCDVGIFIGCRVGVKLYRPKVIGYFRRAGIYLDVTNGVGLSRHLDKAGNPYPAGSVENGADGLYMHLPYILGGRVGFAVLGARPETGATDYGDPYYDEQLGATIADARGSFGASDLVVEGGWLYGPDHHSGRRLKDPELDGGVLTETSLASEPDDAPAAVYIDGLAGNAHAALWNIDFNNTRVATFEAFRVRLRRASRVSFSSYHSEGRSSGKMDTAGNPIDTNDYATISWGDVAATDEATNVKIVGGDNTSIIDGLSHCYSSVPPDLQTDAGRYYIGGYVSASAGDLDLRAATAVDSIRLRGGANSIALLSTSAMTFYPSVLRMGGTSGPTWTVGSGSPEGVVSAPIGSEYNDTTNGVKYMKKSGAGNTGWKLVTQAA